MISGIIAFIVSCVVEVLCNPYIQQFRQIVIDKELDIVQYDKMTIMIKYALQLIVFIFVYFIIELVKCFIKKHG